MAFRPTFAIVLAIVFAGEITPLLGIEPDATPSRQSATAAGAVPANGAVPAAAAVPADGDEAARYAKMPWHLVDIWWDLRQEARFESYSIDVTIGDDVSPDVNLYVAPIGLGHLNQTAFYGGLQTQSDGNTKDDPKLRKIGRGLLMSMWGERSTTAIRPADGGFFQSSGHEGDFVSVRRPFAWKAGTYTYRIVKMDREVIDGQPHTWVGAFLFAHRSNENIFIGALRFPGENLTLAPKIASFVEIYGGRKPVAAIPKLEVTLGNLQVNGVPVEAPKATAIYPDKIPDYALAFERNGRVAITVGEPVAERTKRQVEILK